MKGGKTVGLVIAVMVDVLHRGAPITGGGGTRRRCVVRAQRGTAARRQGILHHLIGELPDTCL